MKNILSKPLLLLDLMVLSATAKAVTCKTLTEVPLSHAKVKTAQSILDRAFSPPADASLPPGAGAAPSSTGVPPFCRIAAESAATSDSKINMEVWIPLSKAWNGKYEQLGRGAFFGTLPFGYRGPKGARTGLNRHRLNSAATKGAT